VLLALQKMRAIKRSKTRDKREQAHREALRAVQQSDTKEGPRSVAGRIPGAFAGESIAKAHQVTSCRKFTAFPGWTLLVTVSICRDAGTSSNGLCIVHDRLNCIPGDQCIFHKKTFCFNWQGQTATKCSQLSYICRCSMRIAMEHAQDRHLAVWS